MKRVSDCIQEAEELLSRSRAARAARAERLRKLASEVGSQPWISASPANRDKWAAEDAEDRREASNWISRISAFLDPSVGGCGPILDNAGRGDLVDALGAEVDAWAGVAQAVLAQESKLPLDQQALVRAGKLMRAATDPVRKIAVAIASFAALLIVLEILRTAR